MAKTTFVLLFLCLSILYVTSTAEQKQPMAVTNYGPRDSLIAACKCTRYPALCVRSLSKFPNAASQSPQKLAQMALAVSLYRSQNARSYMLEVSKHLEAKKAQEYPMVKDCLAQISDSIKQLSQAIGELRRLTRNQAAMSSSDDFLFHASNVETWASAALTDASFCLDQLPMQRMSKTKAIIRGKILNVVEDTSNALALFHQYAANYQTAANNKP